MDTYEIMTLAKGSQGEEKAKELTKKITELVLGLGGKILKNDFWGKRKLAYRIHQETEGFYEVIDMEFPKNKLKDLRSKLNLENNLVRYLITAKTLKEE